MSTVKARFDGKVFVPEKPVQIPVGEIVEIQYPDAPAKELGTAMRVLYAMKTLPKVPSEDVAEMERLIEEGMSKAGYVGVFDGLRDADNEGSNGR